VDHVLAQGEPLPAFDVHAALLSLPRLFSTTAATVPVAVPYLRGDSALTEHWRRELGPDGFKVGFAWQGRTTHLGDRQRSVALAQFAPLAAVPGVRLFSLQKGAGAEQLADAPFSVTDLGERLDDFVDTAAVLGALDLVVSVDTAVVHLAGALGVAAWVALPYAPDWRWLLGRDDSPWYPTLRLFRQERRGDWDGVFARLADALRQRAAAIEVEVSPGELFDRIAALKVEQARGGDAARTAAVREELTALEAVRARCEGGAELACLTAELKAVHEALGRLADEMRRCNGDAANEPRYTELALAVCEHNDRRAALKRDIDQLFAGAGAGV
jgi:hypothetical protein